MKVARASATQATQTARSVAAASSRRKVVPFWLTGLFLLTFLYFLPWYPDWGQNARLDTVLAVATRGTVRVDAYRKNTGDVVLYAGHYYAVKAPGLSLAGVPIGLAYTALIGRLVGQDAPRRIGTAHGGHYVALFIILMYLETIFLVSVPATVLLMLFYWFLGFLSDSLRGRAITTLALGFATNLFAYSRAFYAHLPAAALLFAGFALTYVLGQRDRHGRPGASRIRNREGLAALGAGVALSAAVLLEYQTVLIALPIAAYGLFVLRGRGRVSLIAGLAVGLVATAAYDLLTYHDFLVTSYGTHTAHFREAATGFAGLSLPRPAALWGMSLSPYRGLLFLSPWLLLAIPGSILWFRRDRIHASLFAGIFGVFFIVVSMHADWWAGSSVGPRYLIPGEPFLAAPIVLVLDRYRGLPARCLFAAMFLVSFAAVWLETLGGYGYPANTIGNPLFDLSIPEVLSGHLTPDLGVLLLVPFVGLDRPPSLLLLASLAAVWSVYALIVRPRLARPTT